MQRKIAARLVELPLAQTATCSHLLRQPLAASCSHLLRRPLAATCSHLQPLEPLAKAATWQTLAATCSHLADTWQSSHLAAPCSHLQPLAATWQPRAQAATWQPLAATRRHLPQVAAASGCQVASFLKIQLRTSCAHNANLSTLSTFWIHCAKNSAAGQQQGTFAEQQVSVTMFFSAAAQQQGSARSLLTCKCLS